MSVPDYGRGAEQNVGLTAGPEQPTPPRPGPGIDPDPAPPVPGQIPPADPIAPPETGDDVLQIPAVEEPTLDPDGPPMGDINDNEPLIDPTSPEAPTI